MKFHHMTTYSQMMVTDREEKIKQYVLHLVSNNMSSSAQRITMAALRNFYLMNDIEDIKWHKLKRFMGEETVPNEDRRYTHEEIHTLIQNCTLKLKSAILLMASSGIRIGGITALRIEHLERRGDLYKISVYKGMKGKGQYYTFCTPEAAKAIDQYLEFRERCGEKLSPTSPLYRKDFDTDFHERVRNNIEFWNTKAIQDAVYRQLLKCGFIEVDHVNHRNRKEVKMTHGFRKFFETMLVNANLHETIIRKLTGHSEKGNLTQLYSKQTVEEMLLACQWTTKLIHTKELLEFETPIVAINQKFDKLTTSLRTAISDDLGKLDKEATSYDNVLDAFRLSLQMFKLKDKENDNVLATSIDY